MKITKGLDVPITGSPVQEISDGKTVKTVAILGRDYHGLKPTMLVEVGDRVKLGQALFTDKKNPGVNFTAPGAGVVKEISRGHKRVLQNVVIELDEDEEAVEFGSWPSADLASLDEATVRQQLTDSGMWTAMRTRPYNKIPAPDATPSSIFVAAMDSRPLAAKVDLIIAEQQQAFIDGLAVLSRLAPKVFVCHYEGADVPRSEVDNVQYEAFSGMHPVGLPGTHIHKLDPVNASKTVWHLTAQDVVAIGQLFTSGKLFTGRVISLAGPMVEKPRLVRTRLGANTAELVDGELMSGPCRIISGSILAGYRAAGWSQYLGRYNNQVSALQEGEPRRFLHWLNPSLNNYSFINVFFNSFGGRDKKFNMTTTQNGSPRAMVPIGTYEDIFPLDMLPTQLLRAIVIGDTDVAQQLGCLELDEEDLALCTFVCHSKYEYGPALRSCLTRIEKEG